MDKEVRSETKEVWGLRKREDDDRGRRELVEKKREEKGTKEKMREKRMKKCKKECRQRVKMSFTDVNTEGEE